MALDHSCQVQRLPYPERGVTLRANKLCSNTAQRGDGLVPLRSLPDNCTPLVFFDPQHRGVFDKLQYGNEGARQKGRFALPAMTGDYIEACCREAARAMR